MILAASPALRCCYSVQCVDSKVTDKAAGFRASREAGTHKKRVVITGLDPCLGQRKLTASVRVGQDVSLRRAHSQALGGRGAPVSLRASPAWPPPSSQGRGCSGRALLCLHSPLQMTRRPRCALPTLRPTTRCSYFSETGPRRVSQEFSVFNSPRHAPGSGQPAAGQPSPLSRLPLSVLATVSSWAPSAGGSCGFSASRVSSATCLSYPLPVVCCTL